MHEQHLSEKTTLELGLLKSFVSVGPTLLNDDIVLESHISPKLNITSPTSLDTVFLTGATGFLGTHIAYELLSTTSATLYCLIRAQDSQHAFQKLQLSLESYGLWSDTFTDRLKPVIGDLGKKNFGLSNEAFFELSSTIDHIYHCGALVNFLLPYYLLKNTNITGLKHVLELSCLEKNIPISYLSTYSVLFTKNNKKNMKETALQNDGNELKLGYFQSKWVCEKIVEIAKERHIPITTYRLGSITGDSETGLFNRKDFLTNFVDFCIKIQRIPALNANVDMTPVNYAAKAIIALSKFSKKEPIYHILNPNPVTWAQMTKALQKIMPKLKPVSEEEWKAYALKQHAIDHPFKHYLPMLKQSEFSIADICLNETQTCDTTHTTQALPHMFCPSINKELMMTYLKGMAYTPPKKHLYAVPSRNTTATLASLITAHQPIFLESFMHNSTAKAAELLSHLFNRLTQDDTPFKTFFSNSQFEAFDGMIQLLSLSGTIAVFDPDCALKHKLSPVLGNNETLRPNIQWLTQQSHIESAIQDPTTDALIIVISPLLSSYQLDEYAKLAERYHTKFVVDLSRVSLHFLPQLPSTTQGIIFGSNLTHYQIPCGGFSVTNKLYTACDTLNKYYLHTSTFGANTFTTSLICETLFNTLAIPQSDRHIASLTEKQVRELYKNFINPKQILLIPYAHESTIKYTYKRKTETIIDALGSFSSSLRGHNPSDIPSLLNQFNPQKNYWKLLKDTLLQLSGFEDVIPAVSSASAVQIAITLALMANPKKPTLILFQQSFSGKTPACLFQSLYKQTVCIDPHTQNAIQTFKETLETHNVGLVWFETIQEDAGIKPLPQPLLEAIQSYKNKKGYFIGIDEIQTGLFRTGKFLNYEGKIAQPDILTIGKGLSDMACPIAAVLCKNDILIEAEKTNSLYTSRIKEFYTNHIASAISHNAIIQATQQELDHRSALLGQKIISTLKHLEGKSLIKEIRGEGLLIGIELKKSFLFSLPLIKNYVAPLFAGCCLNEKHPILVGFTQNTPNTIHITPSLTISENEVEAILTTITKVARYSPLKLLLRSIT